ncbi:MAG: hypothetical protein ABI338_01730 [Gemmatimonadaceae bacterium]
MDQSINCLRCHTPMEPGIIADATYAGNVQEQWTPGAPETSFWTGLKVSRQERVPVTTMRCPKCGALESYARPVE